MRSLERKATEILKANKGRATAKQIEQLKSLGIQCELTISYKDARRLIAQSRLKTQLGQTYQASSLTCKGLDTGNRDIAQGKGKAKD